jgi:hypothetical protein
VKSIIDVLERQELIQKLVDNGYGDFIEKILLNENIAFTRNCRSNKSSMCRILGWKPKMLEDAFKKCREILENDFN